MGGMGRGHIRFMNVDCFPQKSKSVIKGLKHEEKKTNKQKYFDLTDLSFIEKKSIICFTKGLGILYRKFHQITIS